MADQTETPDQQSPEPGPGPTPTMEEEPGPTMEEEPGPTPIMEEEPGPGPIISTCLEERLDSYGLKESCSKVFEEHEITKLVQLRYISDSDRQAITAACTKDWQKKAMQDLLQQVEKDQTEEEAEKHKERTDEAIRHRFQMKEEVDKMHSDASAENKQRLTDVDRKLKTGEDWKKPLDPVTRDVMSDIAKSNFTDVVMTNLPSEWTVVDLVQRAAGGTMLNGINWNGRHLTQSRERVLAAPKLVLRLEPTMQTGQQSQDFTSKSTQDTFDQNVKSGGYSAAVHVEASGWGASVSASASASHNSSNETSVQQNKSTVFMSHILSDIVPIAAVKLDVSALRFTKAAITYLQDLEEQVSKGIGLHVVRDYIKNIFNRFGSHVNTGIVHLGGIYHINTKYESESTTKTTEVKSLLANKAQASLSASGSYMGVSAGGGASASSEQEEAYQNKKSSSQETQNITVEIKCLGGSPGASSNAEWKKSLVNENHKFWWNIIDRGNLDNGMSGIWEIIENHTNDFAHPEGLALLLRYVWHDFHNKNDKNKIKIYRESAVTDFINLLLRGGVAKAKPANGKTYNGILEQLRNLIDKKANRVLIVRQFQYLRQRLNWIKECFYENLDMCLENLLELQKEVTELTQICTEHREIITKISDIIEDMIQKAAIIEDMNPEKIKTSNYTSTKEIQLSADSWSIKLVRGELWSCQSDGISIYHTDLVKQRHISIIDILGEINAVAEVLGDAVAVAADKGLFILPFTADGLLGERATTISTTGQFADVVYDNGRLYASFRADSNIYVYTAPEWKQERVIKSNYGEDSNGATSWCTLVMQEDNLFCACLNPSTVSLVSLENNTFTTIGTPGKKVGNFWGPYLCPSDNRNVLLVVDEKHNRLQVRVHEEWFTVRLHPQPINPYGAVYVDNMLFVSSHDLQTLKKYEVNQ